MRSSPRSPLPPQITSGITSGAHGPLGPVPTPGGDLAPGSSVPSEHSAAPEPWNNRQGGRGGAEVAGWG